MHQHPPCYPAGAKLVISDKPGWSKFWVSYVLAGDDPDDVSKQHRCSPTFSTLTYANRWMDWMLGGPAFEYPPGAV